MEWLPPILAAAAVTAVLAVIGRLISDRLTQMTHAIERLTDNVDTVKEKYTETRARTEEAHRRMDEHLRRYHPVHGESRGD